MLINIFLSVCYFCLDTKVTKKSRKSEASAHQLSHPRQIFWPIRFPAFGGIYRIFNIGCKQFERSRKAERVLATMPFSLVLFLFWRKKK